MNRLINLLLFGVPFFFLPFLPNPFEVPKVILTEGIIVVAFILYFFKYRFSCSPLLAFCISILVFLQCIHLLFIDAKLALFGNPFRLQGLLLSWLLFVFALFLSWQNIKVKHYFIIVILILHFCFALYIGQTDQGRFYGTIGEPNSFAGYIVFLWPFLLFIKYKFKKIILLCGLMISGIILFGSGSRSALMAFILQIIFLFFYFRNIISKNVLLLVTFIGISLILIFPFVFQSQYENRADIWKVAFFAGLKSPLIGNGFGVIEKTLHQEAFVLQNPIQFYYVDSSHNIVLDYWVQGGAIAVGILLFFVWYSLFIYIESDDYISFIQLLGLVMVQLFNPASIVILLPFWYLIGNAFTQKAPRFRFLERAEALSKYVNQLHI